MRNFWNKLNKPILALAPMAGYTNSSFRRVCKKFGADIVYSEMASAAALYYGGKRTLETLKFNKSERPYVVQLFGNNPKYFRNAAKIITEKIKPDGIDINIGCPVKKVFSNGSGAALMKDKGKAREIIKETLKGTDLPVSIKIRAKAGNITAHRFVKHIKDLSISSIMIHGRSLSQGFSGEINYSQIKRVKSLVSIPVLANGGINTPEDAEKMLTRTSADGIAIGRGALAKPWIFFQIKEYFRKGEYEEFDLEKIKKVALRQAKMVYETNKERGIIEMRKHLLWYFRGFENARKARGKLVKVGSLRDIKETLREI